MGWSGSRRKRVRARAYAGRGAHSAAGRSGACSLTFPLCYGHDGVCLTTLRSWPKTETRKRRRLAVKRPGEPLFRRWSGSPPLPPNKVHTPGQAVWAFFAGGGAHVNVAASTLG